MALYLAATASSVAVEPITRIADIRHLLVDQAASGIPVTISSIVTFSNRHVSTLFVNDGEAGIYVEQSDDPDTVWPEVGDRVEITGVTDNGFFAPVVRGQNGKSPYISILGKGALPIAKEVDGSELSKPTLDCAWVTVEADVTEILLHEGDLAVKCRSGPCDFHVMIEGPLPPDKPIPWDLVDRRVRMRGVVATFFNTNRQMTGRFLRVNQTSDIEPITSAERSGEARLVKSSELLRVDGPGPDQRVKIRGVVTFGLPGRGMFLRTDEGGLWVQAPGSSKIAPGEVVEVEGRPRAGTIKPSLHAISVIPIENQKSPDPISCAAAELLDARFDSELVSTEAELLNIQSSPEGATLELRAGPLVFRGWLDSANGRSPDLEPGSELRLSGIAQLSASDQFTPMQVEDKLVLLLRSGSDLVVVRPPPWWTPWRVATAFTAAFLMLLAVYQNSRLRRKRKQRSQRRAFEAVLAERGRFAREIHDSLAQGLTSVSMQLECVRSQLSESPLRAAEHLETARELVRDSMREARRTIWNLRPLALGEADLATALQKYAVELTGDSGISSHQQIEGTPRPLPSEHENALLRIGQESLTNAARHSSAKRIEVRLRFGEGWVTLQIKDDGNGFVVADRAGKGYGLTGMHERVEALKGSLSIDSRIGEGTEVSVTLPL